MRRFDSYFYSWSNSLACVYQQVADHTCELIAIELHLWVQAKVSDNLNIRSAVQTLNRIIDDRVQVNFSEIEFEASQGSETANQLVDTLGGLTHPAQYILAKGGVIKMHRQVFKRQAEC